MARMRSEDMDHLQHIRKVLTAPHDDIKVTREATELIFPRTRDFPPIPGSEYRFTIDRSAMDEIPCITVPSTRQTLVNLAYFKKNQGIGPERLLNHIVLGSSAANEWVHISSNLLCNDNPIEIESQISGYMHHIFPLIYGINVSHLALLESDKDYRRPFYQFFEEGRAMIRQVSIVKNMSNAPSMRTAALFVLREINQLQESPGIRKSKKCMTYCPHVHGISLLIMERFAETYGDKMNLLDEVVKNTAWFIPHVQTRKAEYANSDTALLCALLLDPNEISDSDSIRKGVAQKLGELVGEKCSYRNSKEHVANNIEKFKRGNDESGDSFFNIFFTRPFVETLVNMFSVAFIEEYQEAFKGTGRVHCIPSVYEPEVTSLCFDIFKLRLESSQQYKCIFHLPCMEHDDCKLVSYLRTGDDSSLIDWIRINRRSTKTIKILEDRSDELGKEYQSIVERLGKIYKDKYKKYSCMPLYWPKSPI